MEFGLSSRLRLVTPKHEARRQAIAWLTATNDYGIDELTNLRIAKNIQSKSVNS
jgi:hypothetical protein